MLKFDELDKLEQLKKQFAQAADVIEYEFSDTELVAIFNEIEKYPESQRSRGLWHEVIKKNSGASLFKIFESKDFSDINYVHQQIQNLLAKK